MAVITFLLAGIDSQPQLLTLNMSPTCCVGSIMVTLNYFYQGSHTHCVICLELESLITSKALQCQL